MLPVFCCLKAVDYSPLKSYSDFGKWFGNMHIFCKCKILQGHQIIPRFFLLFLSSWTTKGALECEKTDQPPVFLQQGADKVFSLIRDVLKAFLVKFVAGSGHESKSLGIAVPLEGRLSAEPAGHETINHRDRIKKGQGGSALCTERKSPRLLPSPAARPLSLRLQTFMLCHPVTEFGKNYAHEK